MKVDVAWVDAMIEAGLEDVICQSVILHVGVFVLFSLFNCCWV